MALTTINFSDPVTVLVTKTNTISRNLGDVDQLTTSDSNTVDAINRLKSGVDTINTAILDFRDSADIVTIARSAISRIDSGGLGSLNYNPQSGVISYQGPSQGDIRDLLSIADEGDSYMQYDVANGRFSLIQLGIPNWKVRGSTLTADKFKDLTTLHIYDNDGTTILKTIYSPGEYNT